MLHDTTEFSFQRDDIAAVGKTRINIAGAFRNGEPRRYTACGLLMHSSLAVTTEGLPLGLTAIKFWSRKKFKGANALKKKINPTRVPIEEKESVRWLDNLAQSTALLNAPTRCVHIGDRESDIYELFCKAKDTGTHFLLRTCVDRLAADGSHTIAAEMAEVNCKGLHRVDVRGRDGEMSEAVVELKFRKIRVLPPLYKQRRYPALDLTVLHATERGKPRGRDAIDWKLITDLPITSRAEALEKLQWYALRWKIETFHKILKSGCRAEQSKLRTAERLVNLLAMFCILSWRIFWLTMLNRSTRHAKPTLAFTPIEVELLTYLTPERKQTHTQRSPTLQACLTQLARLGGYLNRTGDGPPGNTVIWRGLSRLTDIELGYLDGVNQDGRLNDKHLGRLDGVSGRGLSGHGITSCGGLSLPVPCDRGLGTCRQNRPPRTPVAPRLRRSPGAEYPQKMAVRDFQCSLFGTRTPILREWKLQPARHGVLLLVA